MFLAGVAGAGIAGADVQGTSAEAKEADRMWRMPEEGEPHTATWMAFGPSTNIWGKRLRPVVQKDLAGIAKAIAVHEPVRMLVRADEYDLAARLCGPSVELVVQPIDDLWMRDTGPVFVKGPAGQIAGVDFNFNGWGGRQSHGRDAKVARFVAGKAAAALLGTKLVLEGGGIEVDGEGTAIVTESCVLNPNRNPDLSKTAVTQELSRLLGLSKVIWLPGIAGKDITDGHTDFYARFASAGVVVAGLDNDSRSFDYEVTRRHLKILRGETDAKGRRLEVVTLPGPTRVREEYESRDFAAGYVNFYVCNGAVIAPEFGDSDADKNTHDVLSDLFPGREVIQLNIDGIAAGGGGIHCTTQQQPI